MIAKISTQAINFLMLPLYTALLSTSEYGEIDVYTSLSMIILPFLTLQLEMGIFRYFITAKTENERVQVVSSGLVMAGMSVLVCTALYYAVTAFTMVRYRQYLCIYYLSQACSAVLLQEARAEGKNRVYGIASFIASALAVSLNALFIAGFHWKVEGILLASILAQCASAMYILFATDIVHYFRISAVTWDACRELLRYSIPLIFNQISSWVINSSDRLIIIRFLGTAVNGVYAVANKFSNTINTFFGLFNLALTENIVRCIGDEDGQEYITRLFTLISSMYLMLATGVMNLLPFVFDLLIDSSYAAAYNHVPILLAGMYFSGMAAVLGSIYIACKHTKNVSITTTLAAVCNIVVHLVLLKPFGLYAASLSTLVSFALLFLYRLIFIRNVFPIQINMRKAALPACIMLYSAWAYFTRNPVLIVIGLLLNLTDIGWTCHVNRRQLLRLLQRN